MYISVNECQSAEVVRRRKLRLTRQSEALRRDDALRTARQRLRRTGHWSLIDERLRRAFQQLCDEIRLERRHQRHIASNSSSSSPSAQFDASFRSCSVDETRVESPPAVSGTSAGSPASTATTTSISCVRMDERLINGDSAQDTASGTSSTEVVAPLCVGFRVTTTSNSTSRTAETTTALYVTTVGRSSCAVVTATTTVDLCLAVASTATAAAGRQSCVTVSSTAARCNARTPSKLPSSAVVVGRVKLDQRPTALSTTNHVVDGNEDDADAPRDSSFIVTSSTPSTNPTHTNSAVSRSLQHTASDIQLSLASGRVPPPVKTLGNSSKSDSVPSVNNSTSTTPAVGCVEQNVPPATSTVFVNGGDVVSVQSPSHASKPERVGGHLASTAHQQAVKQRPGWSGRGVVVVSVPSAAASSAARVGRVPPPVPARTSSALTAGGGGTPARSPAAARPSSAQAESNGHLSGREQPCRATPPRFAAVPPPEFTVNNGLSHSSAFKRARPAPLAQTSSVNEVVTETEIH